MIRSGLLVSISNRIRNTSQATARRLFWVIAMTLLSSFFIAGKAGIRLNGTLSLPVGLYIQGSGNIVEFCPPPPYSVLATARGYRTQGNCPDGASPLAKPIIAREGDIVDFSALGIVVNGHLVPNTTPRAADTKGRTLEHWPFGRYIVARDTVWVASSYNPRSFDSRYFGPISTRTTRENLRPLLTLP